VHDVTKRVSLFVVRTLVDDGLTLAITLVDRPGPPIEESRAEAIERDLSEVSLLYANGSEAAAVSVRGAR
jgi:hypothetical protein